MITLLIILALPFLFYFGPRLIGMGRCQECGKGCAPWDAYCWRHRPDSRHILCSQCTLIFPSGDQRKPGPEERCEVCEVDGR